LDNSRNWWWYIDRISDYEAHMHAINRTLLTERTEFQEVAIIESPVYGKILVLDGDMQSGEVDEFIYHEALVHPSMALHPDPQRVLILGGGEGATLREVARYKCVKEIYMIDIDKRLVEICREHLPEFSDGAFSDPRVHLFYEDADRWVRETELSFDVIVSDLTEPLPYSPSNDLFCVEFFTVLRDRLKKPGILAIQASRGNLLDLQVHSCLYKTLGEVFPIVQSYASRIPSYDLAWAFLFASADIDPLKVESDLIDRNLKSRLTSELRFYDGETHRGIFSLPRYFRKSRAELGRVMQKGKPLEAYISPRFLL
jgi:spermidine synthase